MIFKVFSSEEMGALYELLQGKHVVAPKLMGQDRLGENFYEFKEVSSFEEITLDYSQTVHSLKKYFLPYRENISGFTFGNGELERDAEEESSMETVILGIHACDINAMNRLDKVLLQGRYTNPAYRKRRENMFIIGHSCTPSPSCFCRSMGCDYAIHGFDLFLTPFDGLYFAEINSPRAFHLLEKINSRPVSEEDHAAFRRKVEERNKKFTTWVDNTDLTKILDMEFFADVWKEWGDKCLSCGTCANVCPTCYCYGVQEEVCLDFNHAFKEKQLYSCNLLDFAEVAGGHNFRPEAHIRLKYRYYHKHRGFVEAYEEPLCVGCGRCGNSCLADINVPDVIASVRGVKEDDK